MSDSVGSIVRLGLVAAALASAVPARANAQASGVLQARVRVLPVRPGPGIQAAKLHAASLLRTGGSLTLEPTTSRARVELRLLADPASGALRRLRATVTYLR